MYSVKKWRERVAVKSNFFATLHFFLLMGHTNDILSTGRYLDCLLPKLGFMHNFLPNIQIFGHPFWPWSFFWPCVVFLFFWPSEFGLTYQPAIYLKSILTKFEKFKCGWYKQQCKTLLWLYFKIYWGKFYDLRETFKKCIFICNGVNKLFQISSAIEMQ